MIKKILALILIIFLSLNITEVKAESDDLNSTTIKKVVSIVYDDSGSMSDEKWEFASYSLQNLVALLNEQDELAVVKMSAENNPIVFDLSNEDVRTNSIKTIENWGPTGGTPFKAVETAIDWLDNKRMEYNNSKTIEYWLVVITDGGFSQYPSNMPEYLNNVKNNMNNNKFESILVAISDDVPVVVKNDWVSVAGNHLINVVNNEGIVDAMFRVSGLILGQGGEKSELNLELKNKELTFTSYFPLKKFIVFEQNQNIEIEKITANKNTINKTINFTTRKPGKNYLTSRIIHNESKMNTYIPSGKIKIDFSKKIETTNDKLKILTEPALNVQLKILDQKRNEIVDLNNNISESDTIEFAAIVTNSIDKTPIDLRNWSKDLTAQLIVNNQTIEMQYDAIDNTFYGTSTITLPKNLAYAVVTLPNYFRIKSDVLNLYPKELVDDAKVTLSNNQIDIPYKYTKEFEEITTFYYEVTGGTINGLCNFEFKNLPKGITVSVNDVFADKNGTLSVKIQNDLPALVKIYRNKDYQEIEKSKISINVTSDKYNLKWQDGSITEFILNPIKRKITIEPIQINENKSLNINNLNKQDIYIFSVLDDNEYLTKEELATLILENQKLKGITFSKEVIEYNGHYALKIIANRTSPKLFVKTGNIDASISLKTIYEEVSKTTISFFIKDSFLKYLLPICLLCLLIFLIGHLPGIKPRLSTKKFHFQVSGEAETINVNLLTRLIPYIKEKGTSGLLTIYASKNKSKITVVNDFDLSKKIYINNEELEEGNLKFDLFINDELKLVDSVNSESYIYKNSKEDNEFLNDVNELDDLFIDNNNQEINNLDDEFF